MLLRNSITGLWSLVTNPRAGNAFTGAIFNKGGTQTVLIITVTDKDMTQGVINSPTSDPIALAAQRAGAIQPRVGLRRLSVQTPEGRTFYELSPELQKFRRKLAYGDRYEMLEVTRDKKGNITGHKALSFTLGQPALKAAA